MIICELDLQLQLPMQSVPITTDVVISGRDVQHYVVKLVSDLQQVGGFLRVLRFPLPILFLVFINDIADGMTGLGRLFADDTSIEHIANDKYSLQDMVNLDLAYLKDWSSVLETQNFISILTLRVLH